jgi:hypothetical protein
LFLLSNLLNFQTIIHPNYARQLVDNFFPRDRVQV